MSEAHQAEVVGLLAPVLHTTVLVEKDVPHAVGAPQLRVCACALQTALTPLPLVRRSLTGTKIWGRKGCLFFPVYGKLTCANINLKISETSKNLFQNSDKHIPTKQVTTIILEFLKQLGEI